MSQAALDDPLAAILEANDEEINRALDVLISKVPGLTADQAIWSIGFQEGYVRGWRAARS